MKEKRNKYIFRRSLSLFMAMVLMLTTALSDGEMFFGLVKVDLHLSREAKAVSLPSGVQQSDPLDKVITHKPLQDYLKTLDKSIGSGKLSTVGDLVLYDGALDIPPNVTDIKNLGIATSATSLDLSSTSLTAIPDNNFDSCEKLKTVKLPTTMQKIGDRAFRACSGLEDIDGLQYVNEIGAYAFASCTKLTNDTFSKVKTSLTKLGNGAFQGCTALTTAHVPSLSTHSVPAALFSGCTNLEKVTLQDSSITEIGDSAFENTGALIFTIGNGTAGDKLPDTVNSVGMSAFSRSSIKSLDLEGTAIKEIKQTCFKNAQALATIKLPAGLTEIGTESFYGAGMQEIKIPNTVTTLGERAFFNAINLKTVQLSTNLTEIPRSAFQVAGQGDLANDITVDPVTGGLSGRFVRQDTTLTVKWNDGSGNGTADGSTSKLKKIESGAFNATNLKSIDFLEKAPVATIAANAFSWTLCESMLFPATLQNMGESALAGCEKLTRVEFQGNSLKELPTTLFGAATYVGDGICYADIALEEVKLPSALERIGNRCFSHCASLKTVYYDVKESGKIRFPSTLTTIGDEAFSYCGFGKETDPGVYAILLNSSSGSSSTDTIGKYIGIQDVVLPNSVTTVGIGAFRNCKMLQTITVGSGLKEIPSQMCAECSYEENPVGEGQMSQTKLTEYGGLTDVILPNSVTSIGTGAFSSCMALKGIKAPEGNRYDALPEGLITIDDDAFSNCKSMTALIFPANLKKIGARAFMDAAQMQNTGEVGLTKQYAGLSTLNFTLSNQLEEIGDAAFARTNIRNILLPVSLKSIPAAAFEGCYNLESVAFHEGEVQVKEVGGNAFRDCYSLSSVSLPFTATWAHNLFSGYAGGGNQSINVIPTKTEEKKEIIWQKETDFPFACFANFQQTNLEVTDDELSDDHPAKNLYKNGETLDVNKYVKIIKPEDTSQGKVRILGKDIGTVKLKVAGTVDLKTHGENAIAGMQLTTSYVYNISVVENPITSITLSSDKITEENGVQTIYLNCDDTREYEIRADFAPADATEDVQWKIDDSSIVTITDPVAQEAFSVIRIKAGKAGDAVLTAYGKNVSKTINIKVRVPASEITLSETELILATGDKQTLVATVKYDSKYEEQAKTYPDTYEFSSDNPEVATVNDKGEVTAVAEGTATITAKCLCSGKTAICRITVKNGYVPDPKTVTISAVTCEMNKGETKTLVASVLPEKADQTLKWISSNEEVATVEAGVVTALKPGDVTITAQASNDVRAECRIAVKSPVKGMKILSSWGTAKTIYVKKGEEVQLASFHTNGDCTDILRFKAKENKVASVDEGGHVIAKKPGKFVVKLQAMNGETLRSSKKLTIRVMKKVKKVKKGKKVKKIKTKPIKKITVKGKKKVKVGNRRCLQVKAKPAKTPSQFTWECNKPDVATVDAYGVVTGLKKGKVKITVKPTKGKKKTITFKVVK